MGSRPHAAHQAEIVAKERMDLPPRLRQARFTSPMGRGRREASGEGIQAYRWTITPHPHPLPLGEGAVRHSLRASTSKKIAYAFSEISQESRRKQYAC